MIDRMIFRLYIVPSLLLFASLASSWLFGEAIPDHLAKSKILYGLASTSYKFASWVSLCLLAASLIGYVAQSYKLWQWRNCRGDFCVNCGGIAVARNGRYGPYYHCLACGINRAYFD